MDPKDPKPGPSTPFSGAQKRQQLATSQDVVLGLEDPRIPASKSLSSRHRGCVLSPRALYTALRSAGGSWGDIWEFGEA